MSDAHSEVIGRTQHDSRHRGFQLFLVTLAASAALYARSTVSPLQETMRIALALTDNQMALLQGPALGLPLVLVAVPLGLLIDRHSRVRLILALTVIGVVGTFLTAIASNFYVLFASRCLVGFTAAATGSAAFSLLADLYQPGRRGRANMIVIIGQYGGIAAAFALGGALSAAFDKREQSWRWAIVAMTVPLLVTGFSMLALREPPRMGSTQKNQASQPALARLWEYRHKLAPLLAGMIFLEIALQGTLVWAAPALSRSFLLTPNRTGSIISAGILLSGILGPILGGFLADVCHRTGGPRRTLSALCVASLLTIPAGLFAVAPALAAAGALFASLMILLTAVIVMGTTLLTIVAPNEILGLCITLFAASILIFGTALAPLIVSLLSSAIGGPAMIGRALALVGITVSAIGAALFAFARRYSGQ